MPDAVLSGREQGRRCPESSRQQTQAGRRAAGAWDGQLSQGAGVHPGWCPPMPPPGGEALRPPSRGGAPGTWLLLDSFHPVSALGKGLDGSGYFFQLKHFLKQLY